MNMFLKVLILVSVGNIYGNSKLSTFWNKHQVKILSATTALGAVAFAVLLYDKSNKISSKLEDSYRKKMTDIHKKFVRLQNSIDQIDAKKFSSDVSKDNRIIFKLDGNWTSSNTTGSDQSHAIENSICSSYTVVDDKITHATRHYNSSVLISSDDARRMICLEIMSADQNFTTPTLRIIFNASRFGQYYNAELIHEYILMFIEQDIKDIVNHPRYITLSTNSSSQKDREAVNELKIWLTQHDRTKDMIISISEY